LLRQGRQYLDSLRLAGVEWLPAAHTAPLPSFPRELPGDHACPATLFPQAGEPADAPTPEGLPLEQRRIALEVLAKQVAGCSRCSELFSSRTQTVFGHGPVGAEVCFIGEAPGGDEDAQGLPFVGAAGQLLNKIIVACGMKREEVYVCNILRCRPPNNRTPRADEAGNCREYLDRQLELVAPKFICTLGGCAAQNLLQTTQSLARLRGRFHDYKGIPVLCTYHPAYLLPHRSPDKQQELQRKRAVWEDMKLLLARMGRPVPQR
jgi:DNA polymerase